MPLLSRRVLLPFLVLLAAVLAAVVWLRGVRRFEWTDPATPPPPLAAAISAFEAGRTDEGAAEVERCLETFRAPTWEPGARLLAAARLAQAGRAEGALAFLPRDPDLSGVLAPWASLLRARALLGTGNPRAAADAAARAAADPAFPDREEAVRIRALALAASGKASEALEILDAEKGSALGLEAASLAARSGDKDGARRRLVRLVLALPAGEDGERALDRLFTLVPDPGRRFDEAERLSVVETAQRWRESGRAQGAWELLQGSRPSDTPPSALPPAEALARAEALLRLGRLSEAPPLVARAAVAGGEVADAALYLSARIHQARGQRARYRRTLEALAQRRPASPATIRALLDLARLVEGRPSRAALLAFQRYRAVAGPQADPTALWREAWIAHELGLRREADELTDLVFARRDAHDSVRLAALYWKGRRLEAAGRRDAAHECWREILGGFPNHYYGLLAERRLGLPSPTVHDRAPGPASPGGSAQRWLEAARALLSVGLAEEAWRAYGAAAAAAAGADLRAVALEAARSALQQGATSEAVKFITTAVGEQDGARLEDLPLRFWKVLLPAPQSDSLVRAARESGLDPLLVAAVVLEESAFNPLAVSRVGATGLLQLMPETAADLARRIGLRTFRPEHLYEPETNLRLGCVYLKTLLERHRSFPIALAAYNAGPTRAAAWTVPGDVRDGERFVERIPLPDTRRYVKRILADLRLYRIVWRDGFPGARS